jgi:uncharacterized RDD family membrane protein YckC
LRDGNSIASARAVSAVATSIAGKLDTTLSIETPESVVFSHQLAGPAVRSAAYLLDLLIRGAFLFFVFVGLSIGSIATGRFSGVETGLVLLLFFGLEWGYFVVFDLLLAGTSPGKRLLGLRVIHESGRPITASESVLRNLLRAADILPLFYAIGLTTMCCDRNFRRLGDLVAGTVVVREPRLRLRNQKAQLPRVDVPGLPPRPRLTRGELAALALFERRVARLGQGRAEELAEILAPKLRARYGLGKVRGVDLLRGLLARASRS